MGLSISLLKQNHKKLNRRAENSNSAVFIPYQILRTLPTPNFDSSAHPEFAQLVTREDIDSIKGERTPFKVLDAVDDFVDFLDTPDM